MVLLILGVILFAAVHFIPSLAPSIKNDWVAKMGENGYKGLFSLALLASFALMILGWRSADAQYLYQPPVALHTAALLLMCLAFLLMAASSLKSRLRQFVRHPQLTGLGLWSIAHLLLNGDSRSLVLFGGLGLWALVSIIAISKREGEWKKDEVPALSAELILLAVAAVTVTVVVFIHPWLSGVPAL